MDATNHKRSGSAVSGTFLFVGKNAAFLLYFTVWITGAAGSSQMISMRLFLVALVAPDLKRHLFANHHGQPKVVYSLLSHKIRTVGKIAMKLN